MVYEQDFIHRHSYSIIAFFVGGGDGGGAGAGEGAAFFSFVSSDTLPHYANVYTTKYTYPSERGSDYIKFTNLFG